MGDVITISSFDAQVDDVLKRYSKLVKHIIDGKIMLKGEIDLVDTFGVYRDTYCVEIHSTPGYPYRFPYVFETGGRIPRNIEWHIFESDGHCCIKVEPEEILICKKGISLLDFLDNQVVPYFFNQTFRRLNGYFINERSHGLLGIVEFYKQKLNEENIFRLLGLLKFILKGIEPDRVSLCFCGSGLKYRKCHRDRFRLIREIGVEALSRHVRLLQTILEEIAKK